MSEQEQASSAPEPTHAPAETQVATPAETDAPADNAADAAPAEAEQTEKPEAPKRDGIKERLGELTRQRREAERERDLYRQMLERQMVAQPQQVQAPQAPAEQAPDPSKFSGGEYDPAYLDALVDYRSKKAVTDTFRQMQEQHQRMRAQQDFQQRAAAFMERENQVRAEMPDYDEHANRAAAHFARNGRQYAETIADAVSDEENGPETLAYLGQNEAEARRIAQMRPAAAVREIGRIAERLRVQREAAASRQTKAPDPPPTVRTRGPAAPTLEGAKSFKDYERLRMAQLEERAKAR